MLTNVTIAGNTATAGTGSNIVTGRGGGSWNNSAGDQISGYAGTNKDEASLFITPDPAVAGSPKTGGNYRLDSGSPAINTGSNGLYPASSAAYSPIDEVITYTMYLPQAAETAFRAALAAALEKDLAGTTRTQGTSIDMGAYEKE
jgi:hypothetical protein